MENFPKGIKYNLKDYCKDCNCFSIDYCSYSSVGTTFTEIKCENQDLCERLLDRLKKEARKQIIEELNTNN